MRICFQVPLDGFTEILHPLVVVEGGLGCNSTTLITAHGANDFTIPSTIYLDLSQASLFDNIGLDSMMHPILPAHAGPILLRGAMYLMPMQNLRRNGL